MISLLLLLSACFPQGAADNSGQLFYVTVTPSPTPVPLDLSRQYQAMKPAFSNDVDRLAGRATHYQIEVLLLPDSLQPNSTPELLGSLRVQYTNNESVLLNQIFFRLFPNTPAYGGSMTINHVFVNNQPVQTTLVSENSALLIPLSKALAPGEQVEIVLTYQATIPTSTGPGNGLYAMDQGILTLAGFFPIIPAFDEQGWHLDVAPTYADATYTDIAFYDVTLTTPAEMVIASSGSIIDNQEDDHGGRTIRAVSGPMRDFYIALSPTYAQLSQEANGVTVTSYFPAGAEETGRLALQISAEALTIFEDLLGPYPYREFAVAAVPMPAHLGGFEYPGVVVLAERYYQGPNDLMEFITAHEVAHQWWYGLVGSDQLNQPWLDEALTQYTTIHYFEQRYGPERGQEMANLMFDLPYNQLRTNGTDRAVFGSASDLPEPLFQPLVYGKGPLFFANLRRELGDEAYFTALQTYARRYRYSTAGPEALLSIFREVGGPTVDSLYQTWILGK